MLLVCGGLPGWVATAAEFPLAITDAGEAIQVTWRSESVTASAPFLHPEFEFQTSSNLLEWETYGGPIPGGALASLTVPHFMSIAKETGQGFYRLTSRVTLAGADLSELNLAGADFSNADLSGADLSGANLQGADFTGATLAGADFTDATLAGAQFRGLAERLSLAALGGDDLAEASGMTPYLEYMPREEDYPEELLATGQRSPTIVSAMPALTTTVLQLNAQLIVVGARIVGSIPGVTGQVRTILTLKLPTTTDTVDAAVATLKASGVFDVVVRDGVSEVEALPREPQFLPDWEWTDPPGNGNWGFELMGVPQLWNLTEAIEKRNQAATIIGIVDGGFSLTRPEVSVKVNFTDPITSPVNDRNIAHGTHVAGTIGASHVDGGGIQGVSPFVQMLGETRWGPAPVAWQRDAVWRLAGAGARVINISMGNSGNWIRSKINPNLDAGQQAALNDAGDLAAELMWATEFIPGQSPLLCVSAGNASAHPDLGNALVDARWNSGWANAASRGLVDTILVVEALDSGSGFDEVDLADVARGAFSGINGTLSAPGVNIYSASFPLSYEAKHGTSMATPHVTGLAAYLLAVDPDLSANTLVELLKAWAEPVGAGISPMPRAWHSAMEIDGIGGGGTKVLKMLLDIDDGSPDGNERIAVPEPELGKDRAFKQVLTEDGAEVKNDDLDADGGIGNGLIDMGDFRRWRDWLIQYEREDFNLLIPHGLNGNDLHPKRDLNRSQPSDGVAGVYRIYPRGDFNGDGVIDRVTERPVPGALGGAELTDLEVMVESGLWVDEYVEAQDILELMDSVDLHVSAANAFALNDDVNEASVSVIDTQADETRGEPRPFSLDAPEWIFTVPVGTEFQLQSERIPFGEDSAIVLRSLEERTFENQEVGGDFAVDLVAVEMTARAEVDEYELRIVEAKPEEEEVNAYIEADSPGAAEYVTEGAEAWANDEGSFFCVVRTGSVPGVSAGIRQPRTFRSEVVWRRSFLKDPDGAVPKFKVKPMHLYLVDGLAMAARGEAFHAIAELRLEKRVAGESDWATVFHTLAEIEGASFGAGSGHTFQLKRQEGDIPEGEFNAGDVGAHYVQAGVEKEVPLDDVPEDGSFELRYTLLAEARDWGPDSYAEAFIADPLDYSTAVQMAYGSYGELPLIQGVTAGAGNAAEVTLRSKEGFTYALARSNLDGSAGEIVALALGQRGQTTLVDPAPPPGANANSYVVLMRSMDRPRDTDGDGIDDVYELLRPHFLNPLDPTDANLDHDGDGRSTRQEYLEGTDPETPDEAPGGDDLYPAATFAIGEGSDLETADLNNDGIADLISFNAALYVSLGNADGTFAPPITVAIPDGGWIGDITLSDLNGDGFPDVVFADGSNNRVEVLFGDGLGGFVSDAKYDLGVAPSRAVLAYVNNDAHLDIITVNYVARSVSVLLGNGDGTFQAPTTIDTTDRPTDATAALMNDDPHPDLIITLETGGSRVAVLLNNGDGTFAPMITYPTGSFPQRVAAGDVNGDGMADIITSNGSVNLSNGVSVLLGNGDGTLQANVYYPTGASPRGFLLRDFDGDGDLDLLVAHVAANHHALLFNDGSGNFGELQIVPTSSGNQNVLLVDVDRDGLPDLISRVLTGQAMVTHGLPGGGFDTRVQINFDRGFTPLDFEVADVNADGRPDIVIANGGNFQTVEILINQGAGEFAKLPPLAIGETVQGLALARLDAGPTLDLAVLTQRPEFSPGNSSNQLHVLHGDGTGAFTVVQVLDLHAPPTELLAGDFNGDGNVDGSDLLIGYNVTGELQVFINTGTEFEARAPVKVGEFFNRGVVGDFDGDGITDIAAVVWEEGQGHVVKVLRGASDGVLTESQVITPLNGQAQRLALGDVNSDGQPDLLVTLSGAGQSLVFYPGTEAGTFGDQQLFIEGFSGGISMVDVSQDGLPDLLNGSTIRLAEAGGGFGPPRTYYLPGGGFVSSSVIVADMNGDDRPDLVAADSSSNTVNLLLQR